MGGLGEGDYFYPSPPPDLPHRSTELATKSRGRNFLFEILEHCVTSFQSYCFYVLAKIMPSRLIKKNDFLISYIFFIKGNLEALFFKLAKLHQD